MNRITWTDQNASSRILSTGQLTHVRKVWPVRPSPSSSAPGVDASFATPRTWRGTHASDAQSGTVPLALPHLGSDTRRRDRSWRHLAINRLAAEQVRQARLQSADTRGPHAKRGAAPCDAIPWLFG